MTVGGNINNTQVTRNALLNNFATQQAEIQNAVPAFVQPVAVQSNNIQNQNALLAAYQNAQTLAQLPGGNITIQPDANSLLLNNTGFGTGSVAEYGNSLGYIADVSQQVGQIGYQTAEQSAYYSYLDAVNNYYGQVQQNQLNEYSNRANVALDLEQLALRNNYGIMQKQMEMYVLDAQVREKLMGTFYEIEKVKLDNTFQRAKQIVQSAKY